MERRENSCEVLDYIDHIGAYGFEHIKVEVENAVHSEW